MSADELIAAGFDEAVVRKVIRLVDINEYKRRQSPVGPRITARNFGKIAVTRLHPGLAAKIGNRI